jgi:hypothetical protein
MNDYTFDVSESLAVARLVCRVIFSDDGVDRQESDFFDNVLQKLALTSSDFESSLSEPIEHSYDVVKNMSADKRRQCVRLLRLTVNSDNVVELSELSRLNEILEKTEIFRPDKKNVKQSEEGFVDY